MKTNPATQAVERAPLTLEQQRRLASGTISPSMRASNTIRQWSRLDGTPYVGGLVAELESQIAAVDGGKLERPTALLVSQAETLNAIFHELCRCAYERMASGSIEVYLRLAFKAQAQSRATIQAITDLKNPRPVAYVQQANIANGPQQVNNHAVAEVNSPTKLLEVQSGDRLDTGATGATIDAYTQLEAVGAIHRAKDSAG